MLMSLSELYRVEGLPVLQNKMFNSAEEAWFCNVGDVVLVQNEQTGIVENAVFDQSLLEYDPSYQNEQGCSSFFQNHLENVKDIVIGSMGNGSLIEIGCGKGYFLRMLGKCGANVRGVDPAYEGDDPNIVKDLFRPGVGIRGDGIILRHVLEHIQDPIAFLKTISEANRGGLIYIEVPCLDWIVDNNAWYDVFYEHVNYFRMGDFYRVFSVVQASGHLFGGQYMYIVADLDSLRDKDSLGDFGQVNFPERFDKSIVKISEYLKKRDGKVVVWGAASKGVIFSLYMVRSGIDLDYIVDINSAKQGKYIPCTGLVVSSPEEVAKDVKVKDVVVMNSNYTREIKQCLGYGYNYLTENNNEFLSKN